MTLMKLFYSAMPIAVVCLLGSSNINVVKHKSIGLREKSSTNEITFAKDSDGDGVTDGDDKCPNTPVGVIVDADGCPIPGDPGSPSDEDGDGVPDIYDNCPHTPYPTPVNSYGCPR